MFFLSRCQSRIQVHEDSLSRIRSKFEAIAFTIMPTMTRVINNKQCVLGVVIIHEGCQVFVHLCLRRPLDVEQFVFNCVAICLFEDVGQLIDLESLVNEILLGGLKVHHTSGFTLSSSMSSSQDKSNTKTLSCRTGSDLMW